MVAVAALLAHHIQACASNAYEINEVVQTGSSLMDSVATELGGAVYPTISMSNHSCAANTSRTNMGTTGVLRATKTIFPNEKVFDNYGYFYHVEGRDQRRKMLAVQYFFECNCMACKEDWPAYRDLARREPSYHCMSCNQWLGSNMEKVKKCPKCKKDLKGVVKVTKQLQELSKDFRSIMDSITEENSNQNIAKFSALLQDIERVCRPPCREIITCQQVLLQCFARQGNQFRKEIPAERAQLVPFTGAPDSSDEDDDDDSDGDFDMPGLI